MKANVVNFTKLIAFSLIISGIMAFKNGQLNQETFNLAWQGTWETQSGHKILLRQQGKKVIGDFFDTKILEGTVKGDYLVGTITENNISNDFKFKLITDNELEGEFQQGKKIIQLKALRIKKTIPVLKASSKTWNDYVSKFLTKRKATNIPSETRPITTAAIDYIFIEFGENTVQNSNLLEPDYPESQSFRVEKPTSTYTNPAYTSCGTYPQYGPFSFDGLKIKIGSYSSGSRILSLTLQNEYHLLSTDNNDAYRSIRWDLGTDGQLSWKQQHNGKDLTLDQILNSEQNKNRVFASPYKWTNSVTLRKTYKGMTLYDGKGGYKTYPDVYEYYKIYFTVEVASLCHDSAKVLTLENLEIFKCGDSPCE